MYSGPWKMDLNPDRLKCDSLSTFTKDDVNRRSSLSIATNIRYLLGYGLGGVLL
jgi:hypothetical protein